MYAHLFLCICINPTEDQIKQKIQIVNEYLTEPKFNTAITIHKPKGSHLSNKSCPRFFKYMGILKNPTAANGRIKILKIFPIE